MNSFNFWCLNETKGFIQLDSYLVAMPLNVWCKNDLGSSCPICFYRFGAPGELPACRALPSHSSWRPALWGAGLQPIEPRAPRNSQHQAAAACSHCAGSLPYLCCRSLPRLLSMKTGGYTIPQALQVPFSSSPELQMKSHIPFGQFDDECRHLQWRESNKQPGCGNTSNHNTLHPMNASQNLQRSVMTHQLTLEHFSSFCQNEVIDLGESTQNDTWTSWFPPPSKTSNIYPVVFPSTAFCRKQILPWSIMVPLFLFLAKPLEVERAKWHQ